VILELQQQYPHTYHFSGKSGSASFLFTHSSLVPNLSSLIVGPFIIYALTQSHQSLSLLSSSINLAIFNLGVRWCHRVAQCWSLRDPRRDVRNIISCDSVNLSPSIQAAVTLSGHRNACRKTITKLPVHVPAISQVQFAVHYVLLYVSFCPCICSHFFCTKYLQKLWTDFDEILWRVGCGQGGIVRILVMIWILS